MKGMILNENSDTVSIIVFASSNKKTGDMNQIYILNKDISPLEAVKTGLNSKICFDCKHAKNNTCYVNVGQAPTQVYNAYKKGLYSPLDIDILKHMVKYKPVRFGAYGEPVLIPLEIVKLIAENTKGFTGYTHQWQNLEYNAYKQYFMASVETAQEMLLAVKLGFRYYRTGTSNEKPQDNEILCPNTTNGITCRDCRLCNGNTYKGKNIFINVHGTKGKINKFNTTALNL